LTAFEGAFEEVYFGNGPDGYQSTSKTVVTPKAQTVETPKMKKVSSFDKDKQELNGQTTIPKTNYTKRQKYLANALFAIGAVACICLLGKKYMENKTT